MNEMTVHPHFRPLDPRKFRDPDLTAKGETRAAVALRRLETLWINTGTLCNIACQNCYIESSPTNDRLEYITRAEVAAYLDEIGSLSLGTREIGFTGGEPFMNPQFLDMVEDAMSRGFEVLVLTNAMQPMQRRRVKERLLDIGRRHGDRLTLRISIDHHSREAHDTERGRGSYDKTLEGTDWLSENGFRLAVAGRTIWGESEQDERSAYQHLFDERGWKIDAQDPMQLVLFPEMDERVDVPEITTACWGILNLSPDAMMCASSRMVVKCKGADRPTVLPCTLLPYDEAFEMGGTLAEAGFANGRMFREGSVKLCHPHCAKFCVLGGGSCSG